MALTSFRYSGVNKFESKQLGATTMSSSELMESVEPRQLTAGDKVFLSFAFVVTLARVAGLLGAAFSFLFFAISYAFEPAPSFTHIVNVGWSLALYVASTAVMHDMSKRTYD
jgi:hypothetical protein